MSEKQKPSNLAVTCIIKSVLELAADELRTNAYKHWQCIKKKKDRQQQTRKTDRFDYFSCDEAKFKNAFSVESYFITKKMVKSILCN